MGPIQPITFDPVNGPKLMVLLGYEVTHVEAHWEDIGDVENGPKLDGHPAYDEWVKGTHCVIVVDNEVVEAFEQQANPFNDMES